jgi:hypothetical protein
VRPIPILFLIFQVLGVQGQGVLINELQAANHGTVIDPAGGTADWIELFNATDRTVDLQGMRLVMVGRQHRIDAPLSLPARGHLLLWMDGRPNLGPRHMGFTLPRQGGSLLLVSADGMRILDSFSWKELERNESIGRSPDGARSWRYFGNPTPGFTNNAALGTAARVPAVSASHPAGHHPAPLALVLEAADATIRYTTDGSMPGLRNGSLYTAPIPVAGNTVIRARAFSAEGSAGREFSGTYYIGEPEKAVGLVLPVADLYDPVHGIAAPGEAANYTRTGREWEREAVLELDGAALSVGVRVSGSGSRSLAKRSFKLYARKRHGSPENPFGFPDGSRLNEAMLRADAGPHAFLRNVLMEAVVTNHGLEVDVQPSQPLPLYVNGAYHGLYRLMPAKDAQWLRWISRSEAVDVLEGPSGLVRSGSDHHFRRGEALLLDGAPMDSIARYFDLQSLVDLACLDVFMGRADHDLNVRCYRPRQHDGRWRWLLFDVDLWAPADENTVERMCSAIAPETPYLPHLLGHAELRMLLLARMATLNATALEPGRTRQLLDSVYTRHRQELERDHRHWVDALGDPSPGESLLHTRELLQRRGPAVMAQLARHTGRDLRTLMVDVPQASLGHMSLNGCRLPEGKQELLLFQGIPMELEFHPAPGVELLGWKGVPHAEHRIVLEPGRIRMLRPRLATTGAALFQAQAGTACNSDSKSDRPSVFESRGSQARSGCGIMPKTLRPLLVMPAIFSLLPFTLASSVTIPVALQ